MTTTDDAAVPAGLPSIQQFFSESWGLYVDRLWLLLTVGGMGAAGCMLVTFLPCLAALVLAAFLPVMPLCIAAGLISLSAGLWGASWMQIAMIEAVLDPGRKPGWRECYRVSWPKVAGFSWVSILFFVVLTGGLFAFLLPGLFLGVALAFAPVAFVAEELSAWEAMTRSMDLVAGLWGAVALRIFLVWLVVVVVSKLPFIGWILAGVATPFALVSSVVLYDALRRLDPPEHPQPAWMFQLPLGLAALGLCLMCALAARTAIMVRDAMPAMKARYENIMSHPPDPQKLQDLLAKLQGGDTAQSFSEVMQLVQSSTGTAAGGPLPAGAAVGNSKGAIGQSPSGTAVGSSSGSSGP